MCMMFWRSIKMCILFIRDEMQLFVWFMCMINTVL